MMLRAGLEYRLLSQMAPVAPQYAAIASIQIRQ